MAVYFWFYLFSFSPQIAVSFGIGNAPLPPSGELAGGRSSETEGNFHVCWTPFDGGNVSEMSSGNETAIERESQILLVDK